VLERARAGARSGADDGRGHRLTAGERGAGGAADTATGLGATPDESGSLTEGGARRLAAPPSPDLADPRDEDIVARQLHEAASKERDPVLREKLWQEYERYRSGLHRP